MKARVEVRRDSFACNVRHGAPCSLGKPDVAHGRYGTETDSVDSRMSA